jgi:hypothetical protein
MQLVCHLVRHLVFEQEKLFQNHLELSHMHIVSRIWNINYIIIAIHVSVY